jgi:DNA-binding MarR family transcriptional regulator
MPEVSDVDRDYNLWVLLHQVSDIIFNSREEELRQYGLPATQAEVLFVIKAIGDKATPAQISRMIFRRPHSVSGILDRMAKAGLVKRTKDLHRKNWVRVTLTEKGLQAYKQALKRKSVQKILSSISEAERQKLKSLLETLRNKGLKELGMDAKKVPFPKFV